MNLLGLTNHCHFYMSVELRIFWVSAWQHQRYIISICLHEARQESGALRLVYCNPEKIRSNSFVDFVNTKNLQNFVAYELDFCRNFKILYRTKFLRITVHVVFYNVANH